jgi:cytochrome oxidase assembly protein ShyY1
LNIFPYFLTSRIAATLSALLVIAIGCGAGVWQLNRAAQKNHLGAALEEKLLLAVLDANTQEWTLEQANQRRMQVRGRYLLEDAIWLDNRPRPIVEGGASNSGQSGFYLMMPLKIEGKDQIIWVNRGWAPRNNESRTQLPPVNTPDNPILVEGVVFAHPGKVYELGKGEASLNQPRIEQNFDLDGEAKSHGWLQSPFILRESSVNNNDGLVRNWAPPTTGVDRHYAYAFQWFALALCGFLFWLISGLKQYRLKHKEESNSGDQSEQ